MEEYITLTIAAKMSPGRPHATAVWRWARKGIKARNGERVRLEHVRIGGRIFTKEIWLMDFFSAVKSADQKHFDERILNQPRSNACGSSDTQRMKEVEKAKRKLKAVGA